MSTCNNICNHCNKTFTSKYILKTHLERNKKCINARGLEITSQFICKSCDHVSMKRSDFQIHLSNCMKYALDLEKETYEKKIAEKDSHITKIEQEKNDCISKLEQDHRNKLQEKNDYISKLETKIEKMEAKLEAKLEKLESTVTTIALEAKTPSKAASTTNNTTNLITVTNNNVLNLSQEHVKKVLSEKLDFNVVYAGQAGLAKFVVDYILTDQDGNIIYRCVDPSRQMFEFIDEKGEKVRDAKAEKLIQSLLKGDVIRLGLEEAAKGWNTDDNSLNLERTTVFGPKVSEYAELNRNNTVFRSKVSSLTT